MEVRYRPEDVEALEQHFVKDSVVALLEETDKLAAMDRPLTAEQAEKLWASMNQSGRSLGEWLLEVAEFNVPAVELESLMSADGRISYQQFIDRIAVPSNL